MQSYIHFEDFHKDVDNPAIILRDTGCKARCLAKRLRYNFQSKDGVLSWQKKEVEKCNTSPFNRRMQCGKERRVEKRNVSRTQNRKKDGKQSE